VTGIFIENLLRQPGLFLGALGAFPVAACAYGLVAVDRAGVWSRRLGSFLFLLGFAAVTVLLTTRWIEAGRPPFKSLYESLLLFVWCTALLYLIVERYYRFAWFGFLTGGALFLVLAFAIIETDAEIVNLPAALQSAWFIPHVVVYFFGYAAAFFAFVAACLHLRRPKARLGVRTAKGKEVQLTYAGFMHLAILFAFVLLTAGLVMGALWAKSAWGDYWVWDPKENWALISWLVYVIYLHLRFTRGFDERRAAWLSISGFAAIIFTYLGMYLLPTAEQSAHLYQ